MNSPFWNNLLYVYAFMTTIVRTYYLGYLCYAWCICLILLTTYVPSEGKTTFPVCTLHPQGIFKLWVFKELVSCSKSCKVLKLQTKTTQFVDPGVTHSLCIAIHPTVYILCIPHTSNNMGVISSQRNNVNDESFRNITVLHPMSILKLFAPEFH